MQKDLFIDFFHDPFMHVLPARTKAKGLTRDIKAYSISFILHELGYSLYIYAVSRTIGVMDKSLAAPPPSVRFATMFLLMAT